MKKKNKWEAASITFTNNKGIVTLTDDDTIKTNDVVVLSLHDFLAHMTFLEVEKGKRPDFDVRGEGSFYLFPTREAAEKFVTYFNDSPSIVGNLTIGQIPREMTRGYNDVYYIQPDHLGELFDRAAG